MANVKPIPDGYYTVTPHLVIQGCAEALEFYKKAFGAEEIHRMPGPNGVIMHAEIQVGDSRIMMADEFPGTGMTAPANAKTTTCVLHLYVKDAKAAQKKAVDAGATEVIPVQEMFWGDEYGQVQDPYGHRWSFATHVKDMTPEEMQKAGEEFMAQMAGGECPGS